MSLPAGTSESPSTTVISFADVVPSGYTFLTFSAPLNSFALPYFYGISRTWIESVNYGNHTITIRNAATAWNNYTLRGVLFFMKS